MRCGFASPKAGVLFRGVGATADLILIAIYLTVASILAWLVSLARCGKERVYFALCASSATFGLLRTIFGDAALPAAQYLRVIMLTSAVEVNQRRAMKLVYLLPVGKVDASLLQDLRAAIPECLPVVCEIFPVGLDPASAYHAERQQYHSSELLKSMPTLVRPQDWRLLAVADVDLYIPILKYVFGEAQMAGPCAVVSAYRLRQEFYGLDRNDTLLSQRLLKESIHELGHTLDLRHREDYRCVMASSHSVEWIDLRESTLCDSCHSQMESNIALAR